MATRGRKPKPAATKRRAGNPGRRPLKDEPEPTPGAPEMPAHLEKVGKEAWLWLCAQLHTMGILATSDVAIMTLYCDTWTEYVMVRTRINEMGIAGMLLTSAKTGSIYVNPLMNIESTLKKQLMSCLAELGLSPTARARLTTTKPREENAKDKYFKPRIARA